MSNLKSFEQFVSEKDREAEIEQDGIEQGTPDTKGHEEVDDEAETVQAPDQDQDVEESEKTTEGEESAVEESKTVAEMLTEVYESSCKNEAKAYEEDAHDEHTVETYMKENAALVGALAATALKEMKEDYTVEAYEAACNEMIEAYSKKVNELKEMDHSADAEDVE